jgi:hypothetical protein
MMGRDGQIVVDDRDDDVMDDELDETEDGDDEQDEDEQDEDGHEQSGLQAELDRLRQSNEKLEKATRRNNTELARTRKLRAAMKKHGIEDLDAWIAAQAGGGQEQGSEGTDEGSGSQEETPEAPSPAVRPPMTDVDAEVARRVQLELEKREAQEGERVTLLEDELRISRVESVLARARFKGSLEKALRVLDMDSILIDDEGKVTGAEDAVEALTKEIPEWFDRATERPRTRGTREVDGGDRPRPPAKALTWDQRVAATLRR